MFRPLPALLLAADLSAAEGLRHLREAEPAFVVVRLTDPAGVRWYAVPAHEAEAALVAAPSATVAAALGLASLAPSPVATETEARDAAVEGTVVLDAAGAVVGVLVEMHAAMAAPPRMEPAPGRAFAALPRLEAPDRVAATSALTLRVGFSTTPVAGVVGGPVAIVAAPEQFELAVHLVAVGFQSVDGWDRTLRVTRDAPESAEVEFALVADPVAAPVERTLAVQYCLGGMLCGHAQRAVVVAPVGADPATVPAPAPVATGTRITLDPGAGVPDLTATVRLATGTAGRAVHVWTLDSPHAIERPARAPEREVGAEAAAFVDQVLSQLVAVADGPFADDQIQGIGESVGDRVPDAFWAALRAVHAAVAPSGRAPSVFLLTEDHRLPWEIAWLDPPLDPTRPPLLAAQVDLARWPLGDGVAALPDGAPVEVAGAALARAQYPPGSGVTALPDAVAEVESLRHRWPAAESLFSMAPAEFDDLIEARRPAAGAQLVHIACHGKASTSGGALATLTLEDGTPFTATMLRGAEFPSRWRPLLFLNACEVGRAGEGLAATAGFAGAAVAEGCRGFIAPLWKVESDVAREVAVEFYRLTLDEGLPVATALRTLRARFVTAGGATARDSYLAYVYYGHPATRLVRA